MAQKLDKIYCKLYHYYYCNMHGQDFLPYLNHKKR